MLYLYDATYYLHLINIRIDYNNTQIYFILEKKNLDYINIYYNTNSIIWQSNTDYLIYNLIIY